MTAPWEEAPQIEGGLHLMPSYAGDPAAVRYSAADDDASGLFLCCVLGCAVWVMERSKQIFGNTVDRCFVWL